MSRVIYEQSQEKPRKFEAIRCLDCKSFVSSKSEAMKKHRGHSVHYTTKDGQIDE